MNILVYGAGVLGSLYAARLRCAGHRVTLLARGERSADLKKYGLALENMISGQKTFTRVAIVDRLDPEEAYDLALVPIRKGELKEVLPALAANRRIPSVLFMVCAASSPDEMADALGRERVLVGYAGAWGGRVGPLVRYALAPPLLLKTVIGPIDGRASSRLKELRKTFREAGFPTDTTSRIDAWLKTQAAWFGPAAQILCRREGVIDELAARPNSVRQTVRAIREGFATLGALRIPVTGPFWVRAHAWMPEPILSALWRKVLRTETVRINLAGQAAFAAEAADPARVR